MAPSTAATKPAAASANAGATHGLSPREIAPSFTPPPANRTIPEYAYLPCRYASETPHKFRLDGSPESRHAFTLRGRISPRHHHLRSYRSPKINNPPGRRAEYRPKPGISRGSQSREFPEIAARSIAIFATGRTRADFRPIRAVASQPERRESPCYSPIFRPSHP
jgi:hypothetical protein